MLAELTGSRGDWVKSYNASSHLRSLCLITKGARFLRAPLVDANFSRKRHLRGERGWCARVLVAPRHSLPTEVRMAPWAMRAANEEDGAASLWRRAAGIPALLLPSLLKLIFNTVPATGRLGDEVRRRALGSGR